MFHCVVKIRPPAVHLPHKKALPSPWIAREGHAEAEAEANAKAEAKRRVHFKLCSTVVITLLSFFYILWCLLERYFTFFIRRATRSTILPTNQ